MIPKSLSQRIDTTRFVMMLAVIAIHSNYLPFVQDKESAPLAVTLTEFFSIWLPAVAVPCFFFLSAYLLQTKHPDLTFRSFGNLIGSRCRTILVPYLIWNSLALLIRIGVNLTPLSRYTSGGPGFDSVWSAVVDIYWIPELIPLWFLRNLMAFIVIFPLLQRILKLSPALLLVFGLIAENYMAAVPYPTTGLIYFAFGMAVAAWQTPKQFEATLPRLQSLAAVYVVVKAMLMVISEDADTYPIINQVTNCVGLIGFLAICGMPLPAFRRYGTPGAIFFVYAFHGIIAPYVIKSLLLLFPWHGEWLVLDYELTFLIITVLSFLVYRLSAWICPRLTVVLSGGRIGRPVSCKAET